MTSILQVLAQYDGSVRPAAGESIEPLGAAGGFSGARFWRFCAGDGQPLVLRRWPDAHPSHQQLTWIHANLGRAVLNGFGDHGFGNNDLKQPGLAKLPLPLPTSQNETIVKADGHLWELTPWLRGQADYDRNPSPARLDSALETLAHLHRSLATGSPDTQQSPSGPAPCITRRLDLIRRRRSQRPGLQKAMLQAGKRHLDAAQWEILQHVDRYGAAVWQSLATHGDRRLSCQVCVRDIWHDHLLFVEEQVSGVIDFGAMGIDSVTADIARLLGSLARDNTQDWQRGLDAYQRVRQLTRQELETVRVLDRANVLLSGWNWLSWMYLEQRHFDDMTRVHTRIAENLNRLRALS